MANWVRPYQCDSVVNPWTLDNARVISIHKRRWLAASQNGLLGEPKTRDHPGHFELFRARLLEDDRTTRKTGIVMAIQQPDVAVEERQGGALYEWYGITFRAEGKWTSDSVRESEEENLLAVHGPVGSR